MFIWRNLSPQRIVDCIEHFYPEASQGRLDNGAVSGSRGSSSPRKELPASLRNPGNTPPKS